MSPEAVDMIDEGLLETPGQQMTEDDLQGIVRAELDAAVMFIDGEVSPLRSLAADYYAAKPFGNEVAGRSRVISQDCRDTVQAILPSLVRIFLGSERVVEYAPRTEADVEMAAQATDYVQYLLAEQNGFLVLYEAFKDALIRKSGVLKFWAERRFDVRTERHSGLDQDQLDMILADDGVEAVEIVQGDDLMISATIRRTSEDVDIRIDCIPPEEFLISREARNIETARVVAHRSLKTVSELAAMGYTPDEIDDAGIGSTNSLETNLERTGRAPWNTFAWDDSQNPAMRPVDWTEAFMFIDFDGDGIAELRRVCLMGSGDKVVVNEPVDCRPFAMLCPDPEPHMAIGNSAVDIVMDIQLIKSQIQRLMLDSLAQTITPETVALEGQVNLDDLQRNEIGKTVRVRQIGAYQHLDKPFNGQYAMPVLQYMDKVREARTGITEASQGLNANALQSSTASAVTATVTAAQEHIELIARIFAETGMKDLFRGLLRLVVAHQDREKMVKIRGQFVKMNPSAWDSTMDVTIDVGLGGGTRQDKLLSLNGIAAKQEMLLQNYGLQNPVVSLSQYSHTLRKLAELAGFRDSSQFFNQVPGNWQPPPTPPQEDPQAKTALILAQVEQEKTRADIATNAAKLDLERDKMWMEHETDREKLYAESRIKLAEMKLKYGTDLSRVLADIELNAAKLQQSAAARVDEVQVQ